MPQEERNQTSDTDDKSEVNRNNKSNYEPVIIPLPGYRSNHGAYTIFPEKYNKKSTEPPRTYVGRRNIIESLKSLLNESKNKRGTYLVAGYRGVGKTSVINIAIDSYIKQNKQDWYKLFKRKIKTHKLVFNLSDSKNLSPIDIYQSIATLVLKSLGKEKIQRSNHESNLLWAVLFSFFLYIAFLFFDPNDLKMNNFEAFSNNIFISIFLPLLLALFSLFTLLRSSIKLKRKLPKAKETLNNLISRISHEVSSLKGIQQRHVGFVFTQNTKSLPVPIREIEDTIIGVLDTLKNEHEFIFVIDEIDKISSTDKETTIQSEDHNVTELLSNLKSFLTTAHARFFFVSGRETLDSYYSEKGNANSLYLSLFDRVFEVPSLLTDTVKGLEKSTQISSLIERYVCSRILPNKYKYQSKNLTLNNYFEYLTSSDVDPITTDAKYTILLLRYFISYLTFHSWGNPKRLSSIFESFIIPKKTYQQINEKPNQNEHDFYLFFDTNHQRSFSLAAELTTLFQHQLSREVTKISDKLTISTLSSLHFILKFHPFGFTRESLHRMSEAINTYRSPELNIIIDDLLTQVLKPYIRRVRNGSYRYRFHSGFEQEIRYVSHISELESASYNFSLDSMKSVKPFFEKYISDNKNDLQTVKSLLALGELSTIEQSNSSASFYYTRATSILSKLTKISIKSEIKDPELIMLYIDAMLKHGDLEEIRQNYNYAASIYSSALTMLHKYCDSMDKEKIDSVIKTNISSEKINTILQETEDYISSLKSGDSKWDLLKQPFWALQFLSLKRSPSLTSLPKLPSFLYDEESNDIRSQYKQATLRFFLGKIDVSTEYFISAFNQCVENNAELYPVYQKRRENDNDSSDTWKARCERNAYIGGHCLTGLAENALINQSIITIKEIFQPKNISSKDKESIIAKIIDDIFHENIAKQIPPESRKQYDIHIKEYISDTTIFCIIEKAGEFFRENRLYISAAITYLKLIAYHTFALDFISHQRKQEEESKKSPDEYDNIFNAIDKAAQSCIECINLGRQIESSQIIKTFVMRDLRDKSENNLFEYSRLLEKLSDSNILTDDDSKLHMNEEMSWQYSYWGQKLVSLLIWKAYVQKRLGQPIINTDDYPRDFSTFSVRSGIILRWIYARDLYSENLENKLVYKKEDKYVLGEKGNFLIAQIRSKNMDNTVLKEAYNISRNLYFALQNMRIISRKNLDLIFPTMPHIYHIQWKVLSRLICVLRLSERYKNNSLRELSYIVQRHFVELEDEDSKYEKIPSSYFDYEYIYLKLHGCYESAINITDPTSRSRTSVLQQKYYCHDDHNDQEFRMDWTLAQMFAPAAYILSGEVDEFHNILKHNPKIGPKDGTGDNPIPEPETAES